MKRLIIVGQAYKAKENNLSPWSLVSCQPNYLAMYPTKTTKFTKKKT
jgi:hypothetical protein